MYQVRQCPANSFDAFDHCQCGSGFQDDASQTACEPVPPPEPEDNMCKAGALVGNPILPATAEKYRAEEDFADSGPSPLSFGRYYRSSWANDASRTSIGLGAGWTHNHAFALKALPALAPTSIAVTSPEGYMRKFTRPAGATVWTATNSADRMSMSADGAWVYVRADDDATLTFDAAGNLLTHAARHGWVTRYAHDAAGRLTTIANPFGRTLHLAYDTSGRLVSVAGSGARTVSYGYDASGRLHTVSYADGRSRTFLYENTSFPNVLTGLLDEAGVRFGTFAYDSSGRAISTELAGAAERYSLMYLTGMSIVTDPLGTMRVFKYGTTAGKLAVTAGSLPSGTGSPSDGAAKRTQDANGLVTSETDFKGIVTITAWDVSRRLPLSVVRAAGTADAQTVTTQWHATFALPVLVTESGRATSFTYDAQGRTLSQTVTHTAPSPSKVQTRQWTYNPQGLVATETAPNGAVTSYTYDASGNLTQSTNALGHVTAYTYDAANRMLSQTAPNGLVTTYVWDSRDRLVTQTVGSQRTTRYTYTPDGNIATLAYPSGLTVSYTYDAAHRLIGWSNNRSESGSYTLDGMGNRLSEQIKNSTGAIAWSTARTVNNINRLSRTTLGDSQTSAFAYDANGERTTETNGLNQSTRYGLDGLRRVTAITDAANASAGRRYNALDDVVQATDFNAVSTSYSRDAQGKATTESSADIGNRATEYDALGLPSKITDALGQATQIQRDALGRPTQLTFADGKVTTLRYDLSGGSYNASSAPNASKGYVSEIQDRSGLTVYQRDAFGRVTTKTQTLANGMVRKLAYSYNAAGQIDTLIYPGGGDHTLQHVYDATGRLIAMNWRGQPLITSLTWNPLGQPTDWTWAAVAGGAPLSTTRTYDTAGRLTQVASGGQPVLGYVYDAAGRITSLSQLLAEPATPTDPNTVVTATLRSWLASYDATGRLTSLNQSGTSASTDTAGFSYDANGNRTASTRVIGNTSASRSYGIGANRLTGFSQTVSGASTSVAYGYNANGDMTGDGLRSYTYDAEGRLNTATTGATDTSPTTRYAHNALGQRVFKTEPLYPPADGDESDAGFMQGLVDFFTHLWSPATTLADGLGYGFVYDEQGALIGEYGTGGAKSTGSKQYLYLPTASRPMPIALIVNSDTNYAVVSDHLNTPRRMTGTDGALVWQWGYSAFGEEQPTVATRKFGKVAAMDGDLEMNLRYPGQYFDKESNLHYNGFRTYNPVTGRYTQGDPIGLAGGWNRFGYVDASPLNLTDPRGLNPVAGAMAGASAGSAVGPVGAVVGGVVGAGVGAAVGWKVIGPMMQSDNSNRPPGAIDAIAGSKEWGRRNDVKNPVDIFHDIKRGNRGRPGSRAADNCSVDPTTGDIYDGQGEHIGNLGEGH